MDITARCVGIRLYPNKQKGKSTRHITLEYYIDPSVDFPITYSLDITDPLEEFKLGDQVLIQIINATKDNF